MIDIIYIIYIQRSNNKLIIRNKFIFHSIFKHDMILLLLIYIYNIFNLSLFILNNQIKIYKEIKANNTSIRQINTFSKLLYEYKYIAPNMYNNIQIIQ